jgi:hypothetical protein
MRSIPSACETKLTSQSVVERLDILSDNEDKPSVSAFLSLRWINHQRSSAKARSPRPNPHFGKYAVLLLALLCASCSPTAPKPNQRTPSTSPSGKFVLTVPIERDPSDRNLPYWRVTISDATGRQLFKDDSKFIGTLNVYWCCDNADRVWLYNSDDGMIYVWQFIGGQWQRFASAEAGSLKPPPELYPDYVRKK